MNAVQANGETSPTPDREIGRGVRPIFFGTAALLFAAATAVTIASCTAMATMGAVPMAGGWLLSGIWLPLCGQSWLETAACFLGMWLAMMVAMMLPSLAPALWRYREAAFEAGSARPGGLAVLAGAGYFAIWAGFGLLVFVFGAALAQAALQFPPLGYLGPIVAALIVLVAGLAQFSGWKARLLAHCRTVPRRMSGMHPGPLVALRTGLSFGVCCSTSCIGPMAALTAGGLMDLRLMAGATLAITAERLLPAETRFAEAIGIFGTAIGVLSLAQALG
jgi:predicted metal-binding membrane protein